MFSNLFNLQRFLLSEINLLHRLHILQVKIWFQNRRMKWRNCKERELLAAGGSREQTLPNRNNPHPDLSDVTSERRAQEAGTEEGDDNHQDQDDEEEEIMVT